MAPAPLSLLHMLAGADPLHDEPSRQRALDDYDVLDTLPEPAFDAITELVRNVFDVPMCAISLIDEDRQWFKARHGLSVSETPRNQAFCDFTIRSRAPLLVEDAAEDARFADNPLVTGEPHIKSYAGVPLVTPDGYNIGALCLLDRVPRRYSSRQVRILSGFAALVIDRLELRKLSDRDFLTGTLSRRAFVAAASREMSRRDRRGRADSALIMFDIDHFKAVNDRLGHAVGDRVLQRIGEQCCSTIRKIDRIARIGGEEFAVLMPETDMARALLSGERLRRVIAELLPVVDAPVTVTASFGIAMLAPELRTVDAWLAVADQQLYRAKHSGRNRCCGQAEPVQAVGSAN